MSKDFEQAKSEHLAALVELTGHLLRTAAGRKGSSEIANSLVRASSSLVDLMDAQERGEGYLLSNEVQEALCNAIADTPRDPGFEHVLADSLLLAGYRMHDMIPAQISRARQELRGSIELYASN